MNIIVHRVGNFQIGQRSCDGYINLTAMATASGKKLDNYLHLSTTKSFIQELSADTGILASGLVQTSESANNKTAGATWGHPQVGIHCSQWCSDKLAVMAGKWVFDWLIADQNPVKPSQSPDFSIVVKAFVQSSQALNRTIHTAIHQQTDSLREALKALEIAESLIATSGNLVTQDVLAYKAPDFSSADKDNYSNQQDKVAEQLQMNPFTLETAPAFFVSDDKHNHYSNQQDKPTLEIESDLLAQVAPHESIEDTENYPNSQKDKKAELFVLNNEGFDSHSATSKVSKRIRTGSLYRYIEKKKLKDGTEVMYPRVVGARDEENINHWRWGFCWEEKINSEWRNRTIFCPAKLVYAVSEMQEQNLSPSEIVSFVKDSKQKIIQNHKFGLIVNKS